MQVFTAPTMIMPKGIHIKVSELAGKRKMQIADLAKEAGVSYDTAKRYWNEDAEGITWDVLAKLCRVLDCSVGELLQLEQAPDTNKPN